MYKLLDNKIHVSVRNLVEFILRSGSLDNRRSAAADQGAMAEGSRIHRKIQKQMGASYQAEVVLKITVPLEEIELTVEGRADGIFTDEEGTSIDEIKGIYQELEKITEPVLVHQAQAVCYGYIYAMQKQLEGVWIQLTYCNIETEEVKRFRNYFSAQRLGECFNSYIQEFGKWAKFLYQHRLKRKASIQGMEFPYPYREGQRDLAVAVYRTITRRKELFIQAPTGIGKTLSVTFPAVKAVGEGYGDKIFYLTAKTITRTVAQEGFQIMRKSGLKFSSVTITAKEKLCEAEEMDCNPLACSRANGHYDRVNEAVFDLITHEEVADRETILAYAGKYQVCPFEMCLDVSYWMDGIICDYNYVFDPNIKLQRFFSEGMQGDYLFLIDEAHNLVERGREMYSACLIKEAFLEAKKRYEGHLFITKKINRCNQAMLMLKRECDNWKVFPEGEGLGAVMSAVEALYEELRNFEEKHPEFIRQKEDSEFFFMLRDFLNTYDRMDENYRVYSRHLEDKRFMVKLLCVNPASALQECLNMGNSAVFFSATLLPIQYYKELLSKNQDDYAIYVHSPFEASKRLICVGSDVSSRYKRRIKSEFEKVSLYIQKTVAARKGNYLVFFPSYRYLMDVVGIIETECPEYEYLVQQIHMTEQDREVFLNRFTEKGQKSLVGFCVIGGIFSEGIDLKGESLIGVMMVGTGLPQVCAEREILRQFYDEKGQEGFAFAYRYPGMNKVLQAAGRLIRTDEDYGVIELLDDRFLREEYVRHFPVEWEDYQIVKLNCLDRALENFWNRIEGG